MKESVEAWLKSRLDHPTGSALGVDKLPYLWRMDHPKCSGPFLKRAGGLSTGGRGGGGCPKSSG